MTDVIIVIAYRNKYIAANILESPGSVIIAHNFTSNKIDSVQSVSCCCDSNQNPKLTFNNVNVKTYFKVF